MLLAQDGVLLGVQTGAVVERTRYTWLAMQGQGEIADDRTTGMSGILLVFPVSPRLAFHTAPQFARRNYPIRESARSGNVSTTCDGDEVNALGVPLLLGYSFTTSGPLRPYIACGIEFGMNLGKLQITIIEHHQSEEPPFGSQRIHVVFLNQLFGSAVIESGLHIRTSSFLSVLLGVRYSREFAPLADDRVFRWDTPSNWKIRFGLMYELPR